MKVTASRHRRRDRAGPGAIPAPERRRCRRPIRPDVGRYRPGPPQAARHDKTLGTPTRSRRKKCIFAPKSPATSRNVKPGAYRPARQASLRRARRRTDARGTPTSSERRARRKRANLRRSGIQLHEPAWPTLPSRKGTKVEHKSGDVKQNDRLERRTGRLLQRAP